MPDYAFTEEYVPARYWPLGAGYWPDCNKQFDGNLSMSGAVSRRMATSKSGSLGLAGTLARMVGLPRSGTLPLGGTLVRVASLVRGGTLGLAGTLTRLTGLTFGGVDIIRQRKERGYKRKFFITEVNSSPALKRSYDGFQQ